MFILAYIGKILAYVIYLDILRRRNECFSGIRPWSRVIVRELLGWIVGIFLFLRLKGLPEALGIGIVLTIAYLLWYGVLSFRVNLSWQRKSLFAAIATFIFAVGNGIVWWAFNLVDFPFC